MSFSPEERQSFTEELRSQGWTLREGVLWSPTGGLFFGDAHFAHWGPAEMGEVFRSRGERIAAQHPSQGALVEEHRQVCRAVASACRRPGPPNSPVHPTGPAGS
jgi:hypothetical protein